MSRLIGLFMLMAASATLTFAAEWDKELNSNPNMEADEVFNIQESSEQDLMYQYIENCEKFHSTILCGVNYTAEFGYRDLSPALIQHFDLCNKKLEEFCKLESIKIELLLVGKSNYNEYYSDIEEALRVLAYTGHGRAKEIYDMMTTPKWDCDRNLNKLLELVDSQFSEDGTNLGEEYLEKIESDFIRNCNHLIGVLSLLESNIDRLKDNLESDQYKALKKLYENVGNCGPMDVKSLTAWAKDCFTKNSDKNIGCDKATKTACQSTIAHIKDPSGSIQSMSASQFKDAQLEWARYRVLCGHLLNSLSTPITA